MKNFKFLFLAVLFLTFLSCNKTEDAVDESKYYDQDENCEGIGSICCDVDGRILVTPDENYNYTYKTYKELLPTTIKWTVVSGDIKIVNGQGTNTAIFKFGKNFTSGKISAESELVGVKTLEYKGFCSSNIVISKL